MASVLPAKGNLSRSSVSACGCSSLNNTVYRLGRMKQAHPKIQNADYFSLGSLDEDQSERADNTLSLCLYLIFNSKKIKKQSHSVNSLLDHSLEIFTHPVTCSSRLSTAPARGIRPLPCVTKRTPPNAWWSSALTFNP